MVLTLLLCSGEMEADKQNKDALESLEKEILSMVNDADGAVDPDGAALIKEVAFNLLLMPYPIKTD